MDFMDGFWFQAGRAAFELMVGMGVITLFIAFVVALTVHDYWRDRRKNRK